MQIAEWDSNISEEESLRQLAMLRECGLGDMCSDMEPEPGSINLTRHPAFEDAVEQAIRQYHEDLANQQGGTRVNWSKEGF